MTHQDREMPLDPQHIDEDLAALEHFAQTEDSPDTRLIADLRRAFNAYSTPEADRQTLESAFLRVQAYERDMPEATKQAPSVVRPIRDPLPSLNLPNLPTSIAPRRRQTRRVALAASLALVAVFALVFAEVSTRRVSPGPGPVASVGLQATSVLPITPVNLTKTVDGMTLHLWGAYADANNVYLWTTGEIPATMSPFRAPPDSTRDVSLHTSDGTEIPFIEGGGDEPVDPGFIPDGTPGQTREVRGFYRFEASVIHGSPASLRLTWRLTPLTGAATPVDFTFMVPFDAGRVVQVGTSATSHGYRITLDRLVIAPSETRAYFEPSTATPWAAEIHTGGQVYPADTGSYIKGPGDVDALVFNSAMEAGAAAAGPSAMSTASAALHALETASPGNPPAAVAAGFASATPPTSFRSLAGQFGVWTLKVTRGYLETTGEFSGDWEFHVVVPAVHDAS
jgi:hypothetical protein